MSFRLLLVNAHGTDQTVGGTEGYVAKLPSRKIFDERKFSPPPGEGATPTHIWWSRAGNDFGCAPNTGHNLDIFLPEPDGTLVPAFVEGYDSREQASRLRIAPGEGVVGAAAEARTPLYIPDVDADSRYIPLVEGVRAELAIPLIHRDRVVGVLHTKDLFHLYAKRRVVVMEDAIRPFVEMRPDLEVAAALTEFRRGRSHMAVVRDPGGPVLGIVTLEDVIEDPDRVRLPLRVAEEPAQRMDLPGPADGVGRPAGALEVPEVVPAHDLPLGIDEARDRHQVAAGVRLDGLREGESDRIDRRVEDAVCGVGRDVEARRVRGGRRPDLRLQPVRRIQCQW